MATNPAIDQLYPLSTRDGEAIPLDVMSAVGLVVKNFTLGLTTDFVIPAGYVVGSLYSFEGCILQFAQNIPVNPVDATNYDNALFIPPATILTVALIPGSARLIATGASGKLYIQNIRKWAALALPNQATKK